MKVFSILALKQFLFFCFFKPGLHLLVFFHQKRKFTDTTQFIPLFPTKYYRHLQLLKYFCAKSHFDKRSTEN